MSKVATRGISLVRQIRYTEPNRKDSVLVKVQLKVRCNAEIPLSHKDFQNQYLPANYEAPKLPPLQPKNKKKKFDRQDKLRKHQNRV